MVLVEHDEDVFHLLAQCRDDLVPAGGSAWPGRPHRAGFRGRAPAEDARAAPIVAVPGWFAPDVGVRCKRKGDRGGGEQFHGGSRGLGAIGGAQPNLRVANDLSMTEFCVTIATTGERCCHACCPEQCRDRASERVMIDQPGASHVGFSATLVRSLSGRPASADPDRGRALARRCAGMGIGRCGNPDRAPVPVQSLCRRFRVRDSAIGTGGSGRSSPGICFGWGFATVSLQTKTIKGLHENDFILAAKYDRLHGAQAD